MPMKIVLWYGAPILIWGTLVAVFKTQQLDVAAISVILGGGMACIIYTNHSGYRVAWDDEKIYVRDAGFRNLLFQRHPWRSLPYSAMNKMRGHSPPKAEPGVTKVMPFQVLEIFSADPSDAKVELFGSGLNDEDLGQLLAHLQAMRPDITPARLSKFLAKRGLI